MHDRQAGLECAFSPNRAEKRTQIIEAAKQVLLEHGLEGCTVRAVAAASPLTKSAIHYYFQDMNDLVDTAMTAHIAAFVRTVRDAATEETDPLQRFWAATESYLSLFQGEPRAIMLWHEYWMHCVRQGRLTAIDGMFGEVTSIFLDLLSAMNVEDAPRRARMLTSYLIGTATRQTVSTYPFTAVQAEIGLICSVVR
ncbi:TetR/AcrR family transcriptional regulator [Streptomyces sp. NPDC052036]|uniref:TetR/AcrR family transcriptional regulator n=1 Tax=Streptomyces sp. NPDC052036 TaxID=3155171 RepID=UPI00343E539D